MAIFYVHMFYCLRMKIIPISNINIKQSNRLQKQDINNQVEMKSADKSALELLGNYNASFSGLFQKDINARYDASKLTYEVHMEPHTPYIVADDTEFLLSNEFLLDLKTPKNQELIKNLKPGKSLIWGRTNIVEPGMSNNISREHLKIEKNKKNQLIATDLGSRNGTHILPNIVVPYSYNYHIIFEPNKKYLLPANSFINKNGTFINVLDYMPHIKSLPKGKTFNFPSSTDKTPLQFENYDNFNVIVRNSSNVKDTYFHSLSKLPFEKDYSRITKETTLTPNVPTLLPENSQLFLGHEYTIDTRDPILKEFLDCKGSIIIGRNPICDKQVGRFYDYVSNQHLQLQKTPLGIVATDLLSKNSTMVIPQNRIKPFYNGVDDLSLQQGNIGDCTLLSALYSLSLNPYGKKIIENMVSMSENGDYLVKFPNSKPIKVPISELNGQSNRKGQRKYSVEGDFGIKAIERAYAKYIKNFADISPTMFATIDDGAELKTPLYNLTNIMPNTIPIKLANLNYLFGDILNTGGFSRHVITCATPNNGQYGKYMDPEQRFISKHAYSIKSVDLYTQTVEIVNPHNTKHTYKLGFEEFRNLFEIICDLKF